MPGRSILLFSCAALLCAAAAPGCSLLHRSSAAGGDPTVIRPAKLHELQDDNRERLAGPDSPRHERHTYLGVDVTDDPAYVAIARVLWGIPKRLIHFATGDTPAKDVGKMEDSRSPDKRREGILDLATEYRFARHEPYTKRYSQIGARDGEPLVRAAAIRALNHSRSHLGDPVFTAAIDDTDPAVRLEAAKALANVPAEAAVPRLIDHLQKDDNRDVRIACADALRSFKTLDVARALAAVLNDRDFGVSWQARKSLNLMTGRDFRYDEGAWLGFVSGAKRPFI